MINPAVVVVIASHPVTGRSMSRYSNLLVSAWTEIGAQVQVVRPPSALSDRALNPGLRRALSYIERYFLMQLRLVRYFKQAKLIHLADHSDAAALFLWPKKKIVATVHDLIAIRCALGEVPENRLGAQGRLLQYVTKAALSGVGVLIAVSAATGADIERLLKRDCKIVPNPVPSELNGPVSTMRPEPEGRILIVSHSMWRKQRLRSLELALKLASASRTGREVIVVGNPATLEESELLRTSSIPVKYKAVTDDELCELYTTARCLVQMSSYEGFCWPIVEAQSHGCPVVVNDIPVLRETAGVGAVYVDLENAILNNVTDMLECLDELRANNAAYANSRRFTWKKFVQDLEGVVAL